jgi:GDPmannose 4,6-dehydratase
LRLVGDAGKARRVLGWEPRTTFEATIREMTRAELERGSSGFGLERRCERNDHET